MQWHNDSLVVSATHNTAVVTVTGDLDLSARQSAEQVAKQVRAMEVPNVLVDLRDVGFMDSTGAAIVIGLAHRCRNEGGSARLCGASERHLFLLDVRGGLDLFEVDHDGFYPEDGE